MVEFKYKAEFDKLAAYCKEYTDNLPTYEKDNRLASLIAWCIAYSNTDFDKLPIFWHKAVGTLYLGLRLLRVHAGCKERSEEVTAAAINFLEYSWERTSRMHIYKNSMGCWAHSRFDFQQCYDSLWSVWEELKCQ